MIKTETADLSDSGLCKLMSGTLAKAVLLLTHHLLYGILTFHSIGWYLFDAYRALCASGKQN
jgi:hypothetical protein